MAAAAFWVAVEAEELGPGSGTLTLLQWASIAGFGSAALLRAKLLNIKLSDGKEVALGPEIVVQTFLAILDRELDRHRARRRFDTVWKLLVGVDFERAKLRLPLLIFQAMQTVSEEETQKLMRGVAEVDEMATLGGQDKAYLLGFYLLDLVGEEFLTEILERYRGDFAAPDPPAGVPPTSPPAP